jgi:GNAT superfamily N-acetyltransferase
MIEVRTARPEDWPSVASLLAELGRPDVRGTPDEDTGRLLFLAYLERPDAVALVAEDQERVVGFCDMEFRPWLNFTRPQAWIPDLIVTERARSRGAGRALLARAEELARERDCWGMTLESANWRTRAHAFYIREGWSNTAHSFFKNLTGEPWPPAPRP